MAAATDSGIPTFPPEVIAASLSSPPFVAVDGVINIRDFGNYLSATSPNAIVRPGYLFRSGEPSRVSPSGVDAFRALGIKKVFDLRADVEIAKFKTANPGIEGVQFVRAPIVDMAFDPVSLAQRLKQFETSEAEAFLTLYSEILRSGGTAVETVFLHLRDHPDEPCLLHCTAGKDRTGVFAALILSFLGVSDEDIIKDYTLTTVGLQPALPLLVARFEKEQVYRDNRAGTLNMANAKPQTMQNFLNCVREKYDGVEGYLKTHTRLAADDLARIRANLLVPA
ncbi:protein-tyrosine phosphatase-like protein [Rhodofomes roseus]|uniref:Protein-tyrosine phosphatase-like protein n=1 Tax=Rhodofomes roseus TaxID=34475 RepID=A0A4Y9Z3W3_9APHY|nr:protein-tyrosine phosphatase-like protein [Rhodofomes roseus]KAH9841651.1 protein-tyrosine phosphatase-like protein [Rhodofomes roseus]TFY68740.1 hypothetical protein EVJ58_g830 [Rhodofomes roseus]